MREYDFPLIRILLYLALIVFEDLEDHFSI